MIAIIDYGMGNLGSVHNMLQRIGEQSVITSSIKEIETASKIILPGVGAFDNAMHNIRALGMEEVLQEKALQEKVPFLGICLGMQLLTNRSEEGELNGLSFFDAEVKKFHFGFEDNLKIPHMGWNIVNKKKENVLFKDMPDQEARFYFVHSYHVVCNDVLDILAETHYGYKFTCAIQKENIYGAQFHPEKSHKFGIQLFKNFVKI
jgi:glutamine amidotransferase